MLKKLALTGLVILAVALSGCGRNSIDDFRSAPTVVTGIIRSVQISKDVPGTHLLVTDQNDEYYLNSKSFNL